MKFSRLLLITGLMAAACVGTAAIAAESRKAPTSPPPGGFAQPPAVGAANAPLKGEIHLSPGMRAVGARPLHVSFGTLNQKFSEFSGGAKSYEAGVKILPELTKSCSTKAYSVQDQVAAGCTGSEPLKQCMDKLYKHCVENFSSPGYTLPGGGFNPVTGAQQGGGQISGFSMKQFQQGAQMTAAQARSLSQLLGQYANEVEQGAKALIP